MLDDPKDNIVFEAWDDDFGRRDDFMGKCEFNLKTFEKRFKEGKFEHWLDLFSPTGCSKYVGRIRVEFDVKK